MGKARKPVDVLHECRYKDEIIEKLKDKDWEEGEGYLINKDHIVLFLYDKDAAIEIHPYLSEYEPAEFFTPLKAPYKEWKHVKNIPYDTKYALSPSWVIEIIRILYGGFSAKIMGKVVLGFLPTTKPIIMHVPYKDDYAVFIIAPLLIGEEEGPEETEIYGEKWELDYWLGDKPTYYDLERQIIGFYVEGKIISMNEYRELVEAKIREKEMPVGIIVYSIARPISEVISELRDYGIIKEIEVPEKDLPKEYGVLLERRPPNELLIKLELFVLEPVTAEEVISIFKIDEVSFKFLEEDIKRRGIEAVKKDFIGDILREVPKEIKWKRITREDAERITREILKKAEKFIEAKPPKDIFEEGVEELREKYQWDELIEEARRVGVEPKIIKEAIDSHHAQVSKITGEVLTRRWKPETGLAKVEDQLRRITETLKKHIEKKAPPSIPPQLVRLAERAAEYESATEFRKNLTHGDIRKIEDLGFLCVPEVTSVEEFWSFARGIKIPPVKIEEKIKVRVLEDIPTFMGTDGEIYKLKKGDIVGLPKTNADMLVGRKVAEFVEKERVLEGLKLQLFEKVKKELEFEDISLTENAEEIVKEAVEVYYDTGKPELVRELMTRVIPNGDEIGNIVISIVDDEITREDTERITREILKKAEKFIEAKPPRKKEHEFGIEVHRVGAWHLTHSPGLGYKTYDEAETKAITLSEETGESHRVVEYDYEDAARYDIKSYPAIKAPEKVKIHGVLKTRYRCPICYRAAPDNFCVVHGDVEPIDLLAADEPVKEGVIDLTFLDLFKTKQPEKKRWTIEELHDAIGIDIDYAPEFLNKQRPAETYAEYYARELGVKIEGVEKIVPPELIAKEKEEMVKRIEKREKEREYDIKETIDSFISFHERLDYPEEFLDHAEEALSLISELPLEDLEHYEKKLTPMITRAKELLAIPERVPLKFKPGDRVSFRGRTGKIITCKRDFEERCYVGFDDGYKEWKYVKDLEKI